MVNYKKIFCRKKVLITGGLGFIGSNLAHQLIKLEANVLIIDSLSVLYGGNIFNINGVRKYLNLKISDIRDSSIMDELVKGQDYIFNLAGQVSHIDSMQDPFADLNANCRIHLTILESCRKNNPNVKIIFTGTRGQYGKPQYLPVDEGHPIQPIDVNGIHKATAEAYHRLYHEAYGIKTTILRLTNTYGPRGQMRHSRQGFLNWFIGRAIDNKKVKIYGNGQQIRDFNYVDDVVRALLLAATDARATGEIFNLGGLEPKSLIDVANLIVNLTKSGSIETIPYPKEIKKLEIGDYYANFSKIKTLLGWNPSVSLQDGLLKTVQYYRKNKRYYW